MAKCASYRTHSLVAGKIRLRCGFVSGAFRPPGQNPEEKLLQSMLPGTHCAALVTLATIAQCTLSTNGARKTARDATCIPQNVTMTSALRYIIHSVLT